MATTPKTTTGQGKNQTSPLKTKPVAARGKRGLCAEGVCNTVNKCIRSSEDIMLAQGLQYHLEAHEEGVKLIEANIVMLQGALGIIKAYTTLQATAKTDLDIITSSKIEAGVMGQIAILTMCLPKSDVVNE